MGDQHICFLDSYTLSPGDLDLKKLEALGQITIYDRSAPEDIVERARNAEILITNKCQITSDILDQLPRLKLIQVAATGYNNIDLKSAASKNITVCNVSGYSTGSVAQHVFAMLLNYINNVSIYTDEVRNDVWSKAKDFSYWHNPIEALADMTFGIIGYGQIGKEVSKIASAFGMKTIVAHKHKVNSSDPNISFHDQHYVFENADVLSLHVPLNSSTNEFINSESLALMKSNLILINTGRGGLINELELYNALSKNVIKAALLDVLSKEPPSHDHVLLKAPNIFITPHQAWANQGARKKLLQGIVQNIQNFSKGTPSNVIV